MKVLISNAHFILVLELVYSEYHQGSWGRICVNDAWESKCMYRFSLCGKRISCRGRSDFGLLASCKEFFFLFFTLFCNDSIEQTKGVPQQNCVSAAAEGCHLKRS